MIGGFLLAVAPPVLILALKWHYTGGVNLHTVVGSVVAGLVGFFVCVKFPSFVRVLGALVGVVFGIAILGGLLWGLVWLLIHLIRTW